jgi:hypothetical protein
VLIALTARRYGATVVTANAKDFTLLAKELEIAVVPVDDQAERPVPSRTAQACCYAIV